MGTSRAVPPDAEDTELTRLRAAYLRLKAIVEGTNVGTWEWNVQTGETVFNQRWAEMVGYTLAELEPVSIETWFEFLHPEDHARSEAALQAHFAGEAPYYDVDCRMRHRSGEWIWVRDRGRVFSRTPDGEPEMMFGTHSDITAIKRAEMALRRSEAEFRSLAENSRDVIVRFDLEGNHLYVNPTAAALSGIPAADHIGRNARESGLPEKLARTIDEILASVVDTREPLQRLVHLLGRHLDSQSVPEFDARGELRSVLCIFRDITELVEAEKERRKMQRRALEAQKLESLGVLAGGIAHDFNNILTMMQGNIEMALEDLDEGHPAAESLKAAFDGARRAAELTGQMLAYSGRGSANTDRLELSEVVAATRRDFEDTLPATVELEFDLHEDPVPVDANELQLRQVIVDLVSNAVEALGGSNGTVGVRVGVVEATDVPDQDASLHPTPPESPQHGAGPSFASLVVTDDGSGMDAEVRRRIFEPFFTTRDLGRGLGLSAVQGIVEAHRGSVVVESTPGEGSSVTVLLPLADRE